MSRLKQETRWDLYKHYHQNAVDWFEEGNEVESWHSLLLAAEVNWVPDPSQKQIMQRRLWVERGQLELILAAVKNYKRLLSGSVYDHSLWRDGPNENIVKAMIGENHSRMQELKLMKPSPSQTRKESE